MSPRKVRLVADLIRGMDVAEADMQLAHFSKAAALPIRKLLASAVANAEHNAKLARTNLFVQAICVNQGPTAKRFRPRAFGRAAAIRKRTAHISIVLDERVPSQPAERSSHPASPAAPTVLTDRPKHARVPHTHAHDGAPTAKEGPEVVAEQEKTDVRRKGRHAHQEHEGGHSGKRQGGFFKQLFTRRSGEK